jgi:cell wall-associated NlpC family hydrolase
MSELPWISGSSYIVGPSDTVYSIARRYKVTAAELRAYNNITAVNDLSAYVGKMIYIKAPPIGKNPTAQDLIISAMKYLGQPYRHGWWTTLDKRYPWRKIGIDCVVLVVRAYQGIGKNPWTGSKRPTTVPYLFNHWPYGSYRIVTPATVELVCKPGDVLIFKDSAGNFVHTGIYLEGLNFISALVPKVAIARVDKIKGEHLALMMPSGLPQAE